MENEIKELNATVKEVAERLEIKEPSINQKLNNGDLRGVKPGKAWQIPSWCVEWYLLTHEKGESKYRVRLPKEIIIPTRVPLLTLSQAGEMLEQDEQEVKTLVQQGKLYSYSENGSTLVLESDVDWYKEHG